MDTGKSWMGNRGSFFLQEGTILRAGWWHRGCEATFVSLGLHSPRVRDHGRDLLAVEPCTSCLFLPGQERAHMVGRQEGATSVCLAIIWSLGCSSSLLAVTWRQQESTWHCLDKQIAWSRVGLHMGKRVRFRGASNADPQASRTGRTVDWYRIQFLKRLLERSGKNKKGRRSHYRPTAAFPVAPAVVLADTTMIANLQISSPVESRLGPTPPTARHSPAHLRLTSLLLLACHRPTVT